MQACVFFSDEIVSLSPRLLLIMGLAVFFCWVQAKSFLEQNNINATSGDILLMESTARYGPVALAQTITGPLSVLIMCPIIKECQSLVCQSRFIRPFEKIRYYLQYAFFSSFFLTALMMFENIPLLFDTSIYSDNNRPSANLISLFNNNPIANLTPSTFAAISLLSDRYLFNDSMGNDSLHILGLLQVTTLYRSLYDHFYILYWNAFLAPFFPYGRFFIHIR